MKKWVIEIFFFFQKGSFSAGGPGKGMYSRLYRKILNGRHYVESAVSFHSSYIDTGIFGIHTSVEHGFIINILEDLCLQLIDIVKNMGDVEFNRAKTQLKSNMLYALESRSLLSDDIGRQILVFDSYHPPQYFCEKIDQIDKASLQDLMKRTLTTKIPTIIVAGQDLPDIPDPASILQYFKENLN